MRIHVRRLKGAAKTVLCLVAVAASSQARALDAGYGLNLGIGHTDNVARTSEAAEDENIAAAGADLTLTHKSNRLDAKLDGSAQYREYLDDTFDSEVVGGVVGRATLDIIRERFSWALEDMFGQATLDPLAPANPGNRENVNYLTTGPDFTLPLGSRVDVLLSGRYSDVYYETSDLGNERLLARVALRREMSETSSASINVSTEETEFKGEEALPDFERREAYLNYELIGARTTMGLDVGVTESEQKLDGTTLGSGKEKSDGLLLRARISRRVSTSATIGLDAGREFSDAGNIFRQLQTGAPVDLQTQPVQQVASPFVNTYGTVRWDFKHNRTNLQARASYFDEAYEDQVQSAFADRQRIEGQLVVQRNLSSVTSMYLQGTYSKQDYEHIDREFSELFASAVFQWQFGRMTSLSLQYLHYDRGDDISGDVSENQFWLRLGVFGGSRTGNDLSASGMGF